MIRVEINGAYRWAAERTTERNAVNLYHHLYVVRIVRPVIGNGNGWILYVVRKGYADGQVDVACLRLGRAGGEQQQAEQQGSSTAGTRVPLMAPPRAGLGWAGLGWAGLGWAGLGWVSIPC